MPDKVQFKFGVDNWKSKFAIPIVKKSKRYQQRLEERQALNESNAALVAKWRNDEHDINMTGEDQDSSDADIQFLKTVNNASTAPSGNKALQPAATVMETEETEVAQDSVYR